MRFVRSLGICGILLSSTLSASTQVESSRIMEESEDQLTESSCNSWGYYLCPSTGETFDYDPPRCGGFTKPAAKRACEAACSVACKDGGWQ